MTTSSRGTTARKLSRVQPPAHHVRLPKTAELIAGQLRRQIVTGELKEGDALPPETALLEAFAVSRPTLREAFRVLEAEGLISVRRGAHGGARVHVPDSRVAGRYAGLVLQAQMTTLADVLDARTLLEPPAVARAATAATEGQIEYLYRLCDESEGIAGDDTTAMMEAHDRFHRELVAASGSKTLLLFLDIIDHILRQAMQTFVSTSGNAEHDVPANHRSVNRLHRRVVDAVAQGSASKAEKLWTTHLDQAAEVLLTTPGAKMVVDLMNPGAFG